MGGRIVYLVRPIVVPNLFPIPSLISLPPLSPPPPGVQFPGSLALVLPCDGFRWLVGFRDPLLHPYKTVLS